ncbi:MAG TPA: hypothetical protein VIJ57_15920 [Hanamia sp.]
MPFNKFISIVPGILGSYYFIIILFDLIKSNNRAAPVTTHAVQFEGSDKPVQVSDEPEESVQISNSKSEQNLKKYLPPDYTGQVESKSPVVDLGLETLSGDAYTVNAENLSKFMIA